MSLLQLTRQQVLHALNEAEPSALRWWLTSLASAAGWRDPATDQITSPGLQQFLRLHAGRGLPLFSAAIAALPLPALASLALLASHLHGNHQDSRPGPSSWHHRQPPGTREAAHPQPGTHPRGVHKIG